MANYRTVTVTATVTPSAVNATATVSDNIITATAGVATEIVTSDMPEYAGPYEVTPSRETQTLATAQMAMTANVVVNPIPSNYGLITWDGGVLTVS